MPTDRSAEGKRYLIAGIDTGKTAAIACLDLNGHLVYSAAERFVGLEWFTSKLSSIGIPVIIATDKTRADTTISKLATIFDSVLFTPSSDISVRKKNEIRSGESVESIHERDALAAARFAYNAYRNKLDQAERLARRNNFGDRDKLKAMVILKYSMHDVITDAKRGRRLVR